MVPCLFGLLLRWTTTNVCYHGRLSVLAWCSRSRAESVPPNKEPTIGARGGEEKICSTTLNITNNRRHFVCVAKPPEESEQKHQVGPLSQRGKSGRTYLSGTIGASQTTSITNVLDPSIHPSIEDVGDGCPTFVRPNYYSGATD